MICFAYGSVLTVAFLFVLFSVKNICLKKKDTLLLLWLFLFGIVILAFNTKITPGDDLERYFYQMSLFRWNGIKYAFEKGPWAETPLATILLYFVATTGIDGLLPAIASGIVWWIYFYIIYDSVQVTTSESKYINIKSLVIRLVFVIMCTNFYSVISGIRSPISTAIACLGLFFDFKKNKRKSACVLYFLAVFFHVNALNIIAIRLALHISGKRKNNKAIIVLPLLCLVGFWIVKNVNIPYTQYIMSKMGMYAGFAENGIMWFVTKVVFYLGIIFIVLSVIPSEENTLPRTYMLTLNIYLFIMLFVYDYIPMRLQSLAYISSLFIIKEKKKKHLYVLGIGLLLLWAVLNIKYDIEFYKRWSF